MKWGDQRQAGWRDGEPNNDQESGVGVRLRLKTGGDMEPRVPHPPSLAGPEDKDP